MALLSLPDLLLLATIQQVIYYIGRKDRFFDTDWARMIFEVYPDYRRSCQEFKKAVCLAKSQRSKQFAFGGITFFLRMSNSCFTVLESPKHPLPPCFGKRKVVVGEYVLRDSLPLNTALEQGIYGRVDVSSILACSVHRSTKSQLDVVVRGRDALNVYTCYRNLVEKKYRPTTPD